MYYNKTIIKKNIKLLDAIIRNPKKFKGPGWEFATITDGLKCISPYPKPCSPCLFNELNPVTGEWACVLGIKISADLNLAQQLLIAIELREKLRSLLK